MKTQTLILILALIIAHSLAAEVYDIKSETEHGSISIKAVKEFNLFGGPNKTTYSIKLDPKQTMGNDDQIRIAIRWKDVST